MQLSFAVPLSTPKGAWIVAAWPAATGDGADLSPTARRADKAAGGALSRAMRSCGFKGKHGEIMELLAPSGTKAGRILLAGLGKVSDLSQSKAEILAAKLTARLLKSGESEALFELDLPKSAPLNGAVFAAHLAHGIRLRSYAFTTYRRKNLEEFDYTLKKITLATGDQAGAKKIWSQLAPLSEGVTLARDLVNEPPNILFPEEFARRAKSLSRHGLKVEVLGEAQMKKLGMKALLGVGQGSARESKLVVLQWNGTGSKAKPKAPLALVGKGVCFDSGGLSLKPGGSMMGMKGDMGGAAAVIGTMLALAKRKARAHVVGVIGLVENMPDGMAQRPDDVVESMSGQTIEILNTDAEGRLVLADALTFTQEKFKPAAVIDLATLTGAIIAALGAEYAGLFSNDDTLAKNLTSAGEISGEKVWRFPMGPAYDKMIKSKIADMKNIGGPYAGSITAAQFLQRFVQDGTAWAHLDIAGTAWQDGEQKPLIPSWGTGWGVCLLNQLVLDHYESK